jgi:hypothetical protein
MLGGFSIATFNVSKNAHPKAFYARSNQDA